MTSEVEIVGNDWSLIPEGEYDAMCIGHNTALSWGKTPRVYLQWKVIEPGPYLNTKLFSPYRVRELQGKPRKNGQVKLGKRQNLAVELQRLYRNAGMRLDRMPLTTLRKFVIRVRVHTVLYDYQQRELEEFERYSKVAEMLSIVVGAP